MMKQSDWDSANEGDQEALKSIEQSNQTRDDDPFEFYQKGESESAQPAAKSDEAAKPAKTEKDYSASAFRSEFKRAIAAGKKSFEWKRPDGSMYRVAAVLKSNAANSASKPASSAAAKVDSVVLAKKPTPIAAPASVDSPEMLTKPSDSQSRFNADGSVKGYAKPQEDKQVAAVTVEKAKPMQTGGSKAVVDTSTQLFMGDTNKSSPAKTAKSSSPMRQG